jgi:hypothetical protein
VTQTRAHRAAIPLGAAGYAANNERRTAWVCGIAVVMDRPALDQLARSGELRVDRDSGEARLVGLPDDKLAPM